jgi:hypothetical protein
MILKGSQRGGAAQLAAHLLRMDENDHVELHEVRGFVADDLHGAFREAYAISKGTKCEQFLFSLSLSPPEKADVPVSVFEKAIGEIETKLGLVGQPRAIVFHEKQGRRHAHCVWSRIDGEAMKAVNLSHFKLKLRDLSRELFIEHGWQMPAGLANSAERDPRNFTRAEWQQAKRAERDPRELKGIFQDCWAMSDSKKAFAQALESRGLYLARGDRRGFVAIDLKGEVYSVAKWTGLKTRQIDARLGDPAELRSVEETKAYVDELMSGVLGRHLEEAEHEHRVRCQPLLERKLALRNAQRGRRAALHARQDARAVDEAKLRAQQFRSGVRGLWDRLTGRHAKTRRENEADVLICWRRDADERHTVIREQLTERRQLQRMIAMVETQYRVQTDEIRRELLGLSIMAPGNPVVQDETGRSPRRAPRHRDGHDL